MSEILTVNDIYDTLAKAWDEGAEARRRSAHPRNPYRRSGEEVEE